MTIEASEAWSLVLEELRWQMTESTFGTWLRSSEVVVAEPERVVVQLRSAYARDWVANRYGDVIDGLMTRFLGREVRVELVVGGEAVGVAKAMGVAQAARREVSNTFPGFEPYRSNFTQAPKQFFEVVVPAGPPVVVVFVAAVIHNTIGWILNYRTNERQEWWEASYAEIGRATGIKSKASVSKAIKLSRRLGYVVRSMGESHYQFRLRELGEAVDYPEEV